MSIVHSPHERERHASQDSFVRAQQWVSELQTQGSAQIVIMVVGNKTDLAERRTVTKKEGEDYANANGLLFIETSAKTAENVNELFVAIGIATHSFIHSFIHRHIHFTHLHSLHTHTHYRQPRPHTAKKLPKSVPVRAGGGLVLAEAETGREGGCAC